jgi:hypothetical protein
MQHFHRHRRSVHLNSTHPERVHTGVSDWLRPHWRFPGATNTRPARPAESHGSDLPVERAPVWLRRPGRRRTSPSAHRAGRARVPHWTKSGLMGLSPLARRAVPEPQLSQVEGASPLARGAARRPLHRQPGGGTIPARAGSTTSTRSRTGCARDHPRTRGEHGSSALRFHTASRPSPRARGAPEAVPVTGHPAAGGEQPANTALIGRSWGPSPLARGSRWQRKTASAGPRGHPLSRGEQLFLNLAGEPILGPSPLARGADSFTCMSTVSTTGNAGEQSTRRAGHSANRVALPACAGSSTATRTPRKTRGKGHPRGCGQQLSSLADGFDMGGDHPSLG